MSGLVNKSLTKAISTTLKIAVFLCLLHQKAERTIHKLLQNKRAVNNFTSESWVIVYKLLFNNCLKVSLIKCVWMRCHSYREERDYLVLRNSKHNRRTELTQTETNGITLCMYLNQPRDIMSPVWPGCTPVPPPSRTCPKHFTKESSVISSLYSLKYSNTLISVFRSPATCGHRWGWGYGLTGKWIALFSSSALSLYHNRPLQHLLYCRCCTNQSVKFSLPGSLTYEPVPGVPELFHLRQQLITNPEWTFLHFNWEPWPQPWC